MRIAIIGGGAAGLMATATINQTNPSAEVFLLEKNLELGKKVMISGGGRCNITTGLEEIPLILKNYPRGSKFLQSALRFFPPGEVKAWFEKNNVPLKREKNNRIFLASNNGQDVVLAFTRLFSHFKTEILFNHQVVGLIKTTAGFDIKLKNKKSLQADKVILAVGGRAFQHTGSTGDGYDLALSLGHHITELAPSLTSFITQEKWVKDLAGISFDQAVITAKTGKKFVFAGSFLFTHTGLSGPAVFALSALTAFEKYDAKTPMAITIDLRPNIAGEMILADLKTIIKQSPKKSLKNILRAFVPLAISEVICRQLNFFQDKKIAQTSNQDLHSIIQWIKKMPLTVIGRATGDEFVTAGGIELSEVNPRTMESKIVPNLYLAGEILNIDGFTGGFNLQSAWSTGRLAGVCASQEIP
ncbi:MAG: hypothetical protein COU31_02200 [Candidatus Magasanikbacteria bacterium CG10_big_fil_rev_8_21_14_0_10_40_10]|uniref:Aminoacetone oxidase family FAD-binding enzyme n=1 Tax=Candidatus Magasanikbacteria bacterium CG10_big_fil_rev_8_21_14_0_10_40_10 TaxID=1974648 RepID=A0A2M6W460_9BACT|nr:MAG: hypothetical protein COU31_02200 [Candidatus Magasanikbacteria bacterium CG10_big_fil_rev_8_21_14_0_10_40_10]